MIEIDRGGAETESNVEHDAQWFWLEHLESASHYNRWIVSQILPHLGREILEVGCGNGNFTELLAQYGTRITAVDRNEHYVEAARSRLQGRSDVEILVADATQMEWTCSFDTIVLLDVLEHIEQDRQLLAQLRQGLKPGGKLIVKVPALQWLYSSMDQAIGHYRRYSKRQLQQTLEQAGFSECRIWYFNAAGIPGWWLNGQVLQRTTPAAEQIGWFDRAVPLLSKIEAAVSCPIGLSLFAVATKS